MSVDDRLRRALHDAAEQVDVTTPERRTGGVPASVELASTGRRSRARTAWPYLAAAAAVVAIGVGIVVGRGDDSSSTRLATAAPTASDASATSDSVVPSPASTEPTPTPAPVAPASTSTPVPTTVVPTTVPADQQTSSTFVASPVPPEVPIQGATPPATMVPVGPLNKRCNYTDPGKYAIGVAKAKTCPVGTTVTVRGLVVADVESDTRYLCDAAAATSVETCAAAGLKLVGGGDSPTGSFTGVVSGDTLSVVSHPGAGFKTAIPTIPA